MTESAKRSLVADLVLAKLKEQSGELRDFHVKWLLAFTKETFKSPLSNLSIDFDQKTIYLAPAKATAKVDNKPYTPAAYAKATAGKDFDAYARGLPAHLGIESYSVVFVRVPPKGTV